MSDIEIHEGFADLWNELAQVDYWVVADCEAWARLVRNRARELGQSEVPLSLVTSFCLLVGTHMSHEKAAALFDMKATG